LIIAIFVLSIFGCGVKKTPFYHETAPAGDENIEFHIEKK